MKKLNICLVCGDLYPKNLGGAEIHIVEIIKKLAERGHIIHVFIGADDAIKSILSHKNIILHKINYPKIKYLCSFSYMFFATRIISKFLKSEKIDIIHAKQTFPFGVISAYLAKKYKLPYYVTVQNPLLFKEEFVFNPWFLPKKIAEYMKELLRPFVKYSLKRANIAACVSSYSEKNSVALGAKKTAIVPNGVDTSFFFPAPNKDKNNFYITTTSTLIPRNGINTLIMAFAKASKVMPNIFLNIAGSGPRKDYLSNLAKELNVSEKVNFIGTLTHNEIPALLNKSHLFVRPSRFEGFGVSFIESMACGVPIIACPVGGIVDFVIHNETGILVPVDNPEKLAEEMVSILKDKKRYEYIREKGLELVKNKYSWDSIVDKVEKLYEEISNI